MITLLFLSCVKSEDSFQNATVRLRLEGGIGVTIPDAAADTRAEAIQPTVETLRVLTFNSSGALMGNVLLQGSELGIAADASNHWIITIPTDTFVEASYGDNHVYVVLNESVAGITEELEAPTLTQTDMETIRGGKVAYNELIPVTEGSEPPFIMCVYDVVNVSQSQTTLNLTGLVDYGSPTYGFPMRRTMAKIVLESVYGGVGADSVIVGTTKVWNRNANEDQIVGDTNNSDLIATSAVHILGIELVNVPTEYSWMQPKTGVPEVYTGSYRQDAIALATSQFNTNYNYFDREWRGKINVTGKVPFTRVDALADFWKTAGSAGGNAYAVIFEDQVPDDYFIWSNSQNITRSNILGWDLIYANPDKSLNDDYDHYTIDAAGIVHAYNSQNNEIFIKGAPNDHFNLNSGNFIDFYMKQYWENQNYKPGIPVAGTPTMGKVIIDPAVWELQFDNVAYYIPENITTNTTNQTKLRIKLSIATPSASFTQGEIQGLIDKFIKENPGYVGDLVQDEGSIALTKDNIDKFLWVKGSFVPNAKDPNAYAIQYGGLKREFKGETEVADKAGSYQAIIGTNVTPYIIEVPLNNAVANDHNIYRGHEYRVKLYVTKKRSNEWEPVTEANRSITYHQLPTMTRSGAEDLCIAAEVVTSTSANQLHDSAYPN